MTSSILTVATMKGGSGKSTLASCLAVHWQLDGRRPVVIDADPQRSIARLAARERGLGGVPVIEDASEEVWETAQRLAVEHGRIVSRDTFRPDRSFQEEPLPAVRAPDEARSCLERLATLHAVAA